MVQWQATMVYLHFFSCRTPSTPPHDYAGLCAPCSSPTWPASLPAFLRVSRIQPLIHVCQICIRRVRAQHAPPLLLSRAALQSFGSIQSLHLLLVRAHPAIPLFLMPASVYIPTDLAIPLSPCCFHIAFKAAPDTTTGLSFSSLRSQPCLLKPSPSLKSVVAPYPSLKAARSPRNPASVCCPCR